MTKKNTRQVAFGVRQSKLYPTFEIGDRTFRTRLTTVNEDLELAQLAEGVDAPGEEGQADLGGQFQPMLEGLAALLNRRRLGEDQQEVTAEWLRNTLGSDEIAPMLTFLRTGEPPAEEAEEGADPNAELESGAA